MHRMEISENDFLVPISLRDRKSLVKISGKYFSESFTE